MVFFMIYLHTEFQMPRVNSSPVITITPKGEHKFCAATILLFNILPSPKKTLEKLHIF
jgi:hypothetical protein